MAREWNGLSRGLRVWNAEEAFHRAVSYTCDRCVIKPNSWVLVCGRVGHKRELQEKTP